MTTASIHIGSVKIPLLDYAVSCNAILGIRDSGKTVTAKGIAEQLLDHDIPIVVFDAVGKWRWMKVPGPGPRGRGYKVVVAGGRAPDLVLTPHSVGEIVRSAVKEKIPLIIDLYDAALSKAQWRSIVKESIRIIHYESVGVAHVFLEEAAEFIPQKPSDFDTYAEVEKLARMGGNASVGITLISQRAQEVNKAVLDLAVNLILGCQVGSKAIEWIGKWLDRLSPETAKAVMVTLPKLKSGEAWVWTRSNLDDPLREQMPMCRSLHPDRRTPEVDLKAAKAVDPEKFVARLKEAIPRIIEEAKATDPKELRNTINELRGQVRKLEAAKPPAEVKTQTEIKTVEKRVVVVGDITRLEKLLERADKLEASMRDTAHACTEIGSNIRGALDAASRSNEPFQKPDPLGSAMRSLARGEGDTLKPRLVATPRPAKRALKEIAASNGDVKITGGALRALVALATRPEQRVTRSQLATLAKMKASSGTFSTYMSTLRTAGLLVNDGKFFQITDSGMEYLGADIPQVPQTSEELLQQWLGAKSISGKARDMLILLWDRRNSGEPGLTRQDLAATVGLAKSGTYSTYLSTLRSNGLIEERGGLFQASDSLFI